MAPALRPQEMGGESELTLERRQSSGRVQQCVLNIDEELAQVVGLSEGLPIPCNELGPTIWDNVQGMSV